MPSEIYKRDGSTWRPITQIQYTDDTLTDRNIIEVHYNVGGETAGWEQVFGAAITAVDPAWDPNPNGQAYNSSSAEASVNFILNTNGTYQVTGALVFTGSPTSGTYRPNSPLIDAVNYEYRILPGGVSGVGFVEPYLAGSSVINGDWDDLDGQKGITLEVGGNPGDSGSVVIEIEVRRSDTMVSTTIATVTFSGTVVI